MSIVSIATGLLGGLWKALLDWRVLCAVAALALCWGSWSAGKGHGAAEVRLEWMTADLMAAEAARIEEAARDDLAGGAGREVEDALEKFRAEARRLLREIVAHVTPETDARYPLACGLVRLHDAAALGLEPATVAACAGQPDDAAAPARASDLAAILVANYSTCRADQERVRGWQKFYEDLRARERLP